MRRLILVVMNTSPRRAPLPMLPPPLSIAALPADAPTIPNLPCQGPLASNLIAYT